MKPLSVSLKRRANRMPSVSERLHKRPDIKLLHTFRSHVQHMTSIKDGRIIVLLASGKGYISNKKHTRWNRIAPQYLPPIRSVSNRSAKP